MVAAGTAVTSTTAVKVLGAIMTTNATDCSMSLYNATSTGGSADIIIKHSTAENTVVWDAGPSGVRFGTGLFVTAANTPDTAVVFYVAE